MDDAARLRLWQRKFPGGEDKTLLGDPHGAAKCEILHSGHTLFAAAATVEEPETCTASRDDAGD
jgi:hypothetical protein